MDLREAGLSFREIESRTNKSFKLWWDVMEHNSWKPKHEKQEVDVVAEKLHGARIADLDF